MKHINEIYPKCPSPCTCMNMRRASRAVTQFYDEILKPSGLTIGQLGLLRHLEIAEQTTISELAKTMRIDRTTLNRNMKPLADTGLITITPGKDSRTRQVMLTEMGKDARVRGGRLWDKAQAVLKEYMGVEDISKLTHLLSKLEALLP
jgi:DNA-binding MarR family transcriptional regulator